MKLIAHRGNIAGAQIELENTPAYINTALKKYDCEIDVFYQDAKFYLGHDGPVTEVSKDFLLHPGLWCHAKHYASLQALLDIGAHCFFHQRDDYTVTSQGIIWAFPGKTGNKNTVAVHPHELSADIKLTDFYGLCSNNIQDYENLQ